MVNQDNIVLVGMRAALEREGFRPRGCCYACGVKVGRNSFVCSRGHDNMLVDALLRNPETADGMRELIQAHLDSGWKTSPG